MPVDGMLPAGSLYGHALAVGDLDSDGVNDLVVGAPGGETTGNVYVLKGPISASSSAQPVKLPKPTLAAGAGFGSALAIGDFNGDGTPDLAVGAPGDATGKVFIYFGQTSPGFPTSAPVQLTSAALAKLGTSLLAVHRKTGADVLWAGAPNDESLAGQVTIFAFSSDGGLQSYPTKQAGAAALGFGASMALISLDGGMETSVVVIGAPATSANTGAVYFWDSETTNDVAPALTNTGGQPSRFGSSLATSSTQKLFVGAPSFQAGATSMAGEAFASTSLGPFDLFPLYGDDGGQPGGARHRSDPLGSPVAMSWSLALLASIRCACTGAPRARGP